MANIVVDTNVWITASKDPEEVSTMEEIACIRACVVWARYTVAGKDRILVDNKGYVVREYNRYMKPGNLPDSIRAELYSKLFDRIEPMAIEFDDSGFATLPDNVTFHDPDDRVYVALAISCDPFAPIYNATDSDWAKESEH
ncbi:MAG: hypothetical protein OXE46_09395 [Chloroflexi bacterium]|nr:hypothetical protein [Chloroflexota bacterium]